MTGEGTETTPPAPGGTATTFAAGVHRSRLGLLPTRDVLDPLEERANALDAARTVLGPDTDVVDLLIAAEWLHTGEPGSLLHWRQQDASNFGHRPVDPAVGPDAARWTPPAGPEVSPGVLPCSG